MSDSGQVQSKKQLVLGILIITVGVGWLLSAQGLVPGIDWIWTLGLGIVGVLTFVVSRVANFIGEKIPLFASNVIICVKRNVS